MDCWEGVDSERVKSVANMLFTLWLFSYVDIRGRSRTQMRLYNFIYLKMDIGITATIQKLRISFTCHQAQMVPVVIQQLIIMSVLTLSATIHPDLKRTLISMSKRTGLTISQVTDEVLYTGLIEMQELPDL